MSSPLRTNWTEGDLWDDDTINDWAARINLLKTAADDLAGGKQPSDETLSELAALTLSGDAMLVVAAGHLALATLSSTGEALVNAYSTRLAQIAAVTWAQNQFLYKDAAGEITAGDISAAGRSLIALADGAAIKAALDLEIGTDLQAYSADLSALVTLLTGTSGATSRMLTYVGDTDSWATVATAAFGRSLLAAADAAAVLGLLGTLRMNVRKETASTTTVAADLGKTIEMDVATANTVTINPNVHATDDYFTVEQYGAGKTTLVAGTTGGTMVLRSEGNKLSVGAQYSGVTVRFRSATEAVVIGNLVV